MVRPVTAGRVGVRPEPGEDGTELVVGRELWQPTVGGPHHAGERLVDDRAGDDPIQIGIGRRTGPGFSPMRSRWWNSPSKVT